MTFDARQVLVVLSLTVITDDKLSIFTIFNFARLLMAWGWFTNQVRKIDNWFITQADRLAYSVLSFNRGPVWWAIG